MSDGILAGMRVIEASAFVAAPLGSMTLAQMGADVIRIDPPTGGLDYHRWPVTAENVSLFWCGLNKGKRSVTIDIRQPEGRELASALITAPGPDSGLFITNFPARGAFDYEKLRARREDLIQLTITGDRFGGSAVDYTVNPAMGLPYLTGQGDANVAVNHVLPAWDLVTGHMAAVGILAAERHRRSTNDGQHVTLALEDMALAVMGHLGFIAEAQLSSERQRCGNDLYGAFGRDFQTRDGQRIMIVALTAKQWNALCNALDLHERVAEIEQQLGVDLSREGERFHARNEIAIIVAPWIGQRSLAEVAEVFNAHGVCWGQYQTVKKLVEEDPACSVSNPMFSEVDQVGVGRYLTPGLPLQFSTLPRIQPKSAPLLGQHTEEVLVDILGLSGATFGDFVDRGVVGRPAQK